MKTRPIIVFGKKWNLNQKYFSKKYYVVFFINIKVYNVSCDGWRCVLAQMYILNFLKIFFKTQSKGIPCEESDKLYARSCLFLYSFNCKCGFCDHVIFCLFKKINAAGLERCSVIPLLSLPRKFDQFFGAIHC